MTNIGHNSAAAIRATFSDWRPVKSRKVVQIILEVPIEQAESVMKTLGFPRPDAETWVAVALLKEELKEKPRRQWGDMTATEQAAIKCHDADFMQWMGANTAEGCACAVRKHCGVQSRADLTTNTDARIKWDGLQAKYDLERRGMR